jgi:hypothetical protein
MSVEDKDVFDYEYDDESGTIEINMLGSVDGASIEDYPEVMARVIDILREVGGARSIVLSASREYEYPEEQTQMLQEVAQELTLTEEYKEVLVALYGYTWQLYGDFSGYTDIARGSAKLFGFPRAIAHGMWSKARTAAEIEDELNQDAYRIEVAFKKPVFLPSSVMLKYHPGERGIEFVGALDIDPEKVGRDLGSLVGADEEFGVTITDDESAALEVEPDVVFHSTLSSLDAVTPQLEAAMAAGADVVSTTESLAAARGRRNARRRMGLRHAIWSGK